MKTKLSLLLAVASISAGQITFAADANLARLAAANNFFAFNLLKELNAENPSGNLFVSPYSAATALQMVVNGAGGTTKLEMQKVLQTTGLSTDTINAASKTAAALLNTTDTNIILTTANALWYRQSAHIKDSFLAANQKYFSATIKPLDFSNVPAAENEINQWASDQTHGRITGIANGMIDPLYTDLILANAIYFKGKWLDPFDKNLTKERPFHPAAGAAKNLPMMEMSKTFTYRKGSGYQAVRLPYLGGDLAMYVFLPDAGSSPAKLLHLMNGDRWRKVTVPGFCESNGLVVLPKFRLENTYALVPALKALGMKTAFNNQKLQPDPDFSEMFPDVHHISQVRQKTFVDVAEEGTEAAAVTDIGMPLSAGPEEATPKPFELIVDRPFLFAIVDAHSEMILFMGVVNDL
jgi:serpin B